MARSPIIPVLEGFKALTVDEQKIFLDLVDPQPEPETAKPVRKKRGPSKKAQSLSAAIAKTPKVDAENEPEAEGPICGACGNTEGYQDHFPPSPHFHPFAPPAQPAGRRSPRKGAATSSTANTAEGSESALSASGGGD